MWLKEYLMKAIESFTLTMWDVKLPSRLAVDEGNAVLP